MPRALQWTAVALLLVVLGAAAGWGAGALRDACPALGAREFSAKTVVCRDGVAYALVPMTTDVRVLERQLHACQAELDGGVR